MSSWARSKWTKDANGNLVPIPSDTPISIEDLDSRHGYEDKSSSRSFDTWYQNQTGADLDVSAGMRATNDGADNEQIRVWLDVNDSQSTSRIVEQTIATAEDGDTLAVIGTVPDGYYYRVRDLSHSNVSVTMQYWVEQE